MIATHASITLAAGHGARRPGPHPRKSLCAAAADSREQGEQQGREDAAPTSRRQLGLRLLSAAAALAVLPRPAPAEAAAAGAAAALTPYQRGLALEYGLTQDGRIRSCPSDANPNCVSTASTNTVRCFAVGAAHRPPLCSCFWLGGAPALPHAHNLATAALMPCRPTRLPGRRRRAAWQRRCNSLRPPLQQWCQRCALWSLPAQRAASTAALQSRTLSLPGMT